MDERLLRIDADRGLTNKNAGEPEDGPTTWQAHRQRHAVLDGVLGDPSTRRGTRRGHMRRRKSWLRYPAIRRQPWLSG